MICITGGQEGTLQEYLLICQRPKMQMLAEYEHITDHYWLFPVAWPNFSQPLDLGEKASQNLSHQPSWLNQWLQGRISPFNHQTVYDDLVCLFFVKVALCIMSKPFHFCLVCPKHIVSLVLWFVSMRLHKPKLCCHVYFREQGLSPSNPLRQAILVQAFSNYTVMNMTCHEHWVWDLALGFSAVSLSITASDHGVN